MGTVFPLEVATRVRIPLGPQRNPLMNALSRCTASSRSPILCLLRAYNSSLLSGTTSSASGRSSAQEVGDHPVQVGYDVQVTQRRVRGGVPPPVH
jgi:hypothetical protein